MTIKQRNSKGPKGKKTDDVTFNAYLKRGSPEGYCPAVKVTGATLGSIGKHEDRRRGIDVYEYTAGSEKKVGVKIALGLSKEDQKAMGELIRGVIDKLRETKDPMTKSIWYQEHFVSLTDGTKVFNATHDMTVPEGFSELVLDGGAYHESPCKTWGPFLYGDDEEYRWYTKANVEEDVTVYMYNPKKGGIEYPKTTEEGQVVYPKGGVQVKNSNVLRTLLGSKLYTENQWRATCVARLTSVQLVCAEAGMSPDGVQKYAVSPRFAFRVPTSIVLVKYEPSPDEIGLTDKQREDATRAALFKGMSAPKQKRKAREPAVAPVFKKSKEAEEEDEEDELNTDGED
jgi:hypothetical protein